jgi:anti-anti-sigma factor
MQINIEEHHDVMVVSVEGSLDALTAPDLGKVFDAEIKGGNSNLVADLAGVDYTSSAGLRVLLAAVKETRKLGGDFRLAAVQADVNKVLNLVGFTSIIKQYPDVESAILSFEEAT